MLSIFIQNISHLCLPHLHELTVFTYMYYYKSCRYSSNSSCQCVELYFCSSWYALGSSSQNVVKFTAIFSSSTQTAELLRSTSCQGALRVAVPFSVHFLYRRRHWYNIVSGL